MAKGITAGAKFIAFAQHTIKTAASAADVKRGLCVVLHCRMGWSTDSVAELLQVNQRTVYNQMRALRVLYLGGKDPRENQGGRRASLLSERQEARFLASLEKRARGGERIEARDVKAALEKFAGRPVARSTPYHLLQRHGWRSAGPGAGPPKGGAHPGAPRHRWLPPAEEE
jgi:transposase